VSRRVSGRVCAPNHSRRRARPPLPFAPFSAGFSDNSLVIGGFVVIPALLGLAEYRLYRQVGATGLAEAIVLMTPRCTNVGPTVTATSDLATLAFSFPNDPYADSFAGVDGL
jgi:hypothetical protein